MCAGTTVCKSGYPILLSNKSFRGSGQHFSSRQPSETAVTPSSWRWCPGSVYQRGRNPGRKWWSCSSPYWSLLTVSERISQWWWLDNWCNDEALTRFIPPCVAGDVYRTRELTPFLECVDNSPVVRSVLPKLLLQYRWGHEPGEGGQEEALKVGKLQDTSSFQV